jgi:hypothetical protein
LPAQHLSGRKTRRATTDDYDFLGVIGFRDLDRRPLAFSADEDPAVALLNLPDIERVEGGRTGRLASAKVEAGVMPRTPDSAVDNEPVSERSVVMATVGIDRENLVTFADQQDLLFTDMADQLSIPKIAGIDTLRQVWSTRLSLLLGHLFDPPWLRGAGCASHNRFVPPHGFTPTPVRQVHLP